MIYLHHKRHSTTTHLKYMCTKLSEHRRSCNWLSLYHCSRCTGPLSPLVLAGKMLASYQGLDTVRSASASPLHVCALHAGGSACLQIRMRMTMEWECESRKWSCVLDSLKCNMTGIHPCMRLCLCVCVWMCLCMCLHTSVHVHMYCAGPAQKRVLCILRHLPGPRLGFFFGGSTAIHFSKKGCDHCHRSHLSMQR